MREKGIRLEVFECILMEARSEEDFSRSLVVGGGKKTSPPLMAMGRLWIFE